MGYNIPADHHGPLPNAKRQVKPEPKSIDVSAKFFVRNVQAESFEQAKQIALKYVPENCISYFNLAPYALREVSGSYTVEFR